MKKLVSIQEVEGEGLMALMGEKVLLMCSNYFYSGKLIGVNEQCVILEDAAIVYETGAWQDQHWKDEQKMNGPIYIMLHAIESFRKGK